MAEEKKKAITTATATDVGQWIEAYYSDDAIDYSKKNKVRHVIRTCQFASVCFVISKNSKKAHTDFSESTYATIDVTYVKAAELIIRLLNVKYGAGRALTRDDFLDCGGKELFKGRTDIDQICADYIGPGGMVEQCEHCFPEPKGEDLRREKESFEDFYKWYEPATDDEKEARALEKKKLLYKDFVNDIENVKSDHSQLLALSSQSERESGVLNGQSLHKIYRTTTDKASNMQRELKGLKSSLDFNVKDNLEKAVDIRYNVAKKTAKVAALGGVATASLGAVIGGVFWPAFLIIPTYALAKKWLPDWAKSLGEMWGHFEKSMNTRYERQKIDSYYHYLVSFMETGGKPKIRFKDRFFLTKDIVKCLKKGAKSGSVGASYEGSDERTHKSEIDRAEGQTSMVMGNLINYKDGNSIIAPDAEAIIRGKIDAITLENASFQAFGEAARAFSAYKSKLGEQETLGLQVKFAEALKAHAEKLIFNTEFESMSYFQDNIEPELKEEGLILGMVKDVPGFNDVVPYVSRLRAFASKEISGLRDDKFHDTTLDEYIRRPVDAVPEIDVETYTGAHNEEFFNKGDESLKKAIKCINTLRRDPNNERSVVGDVDGDVKKLDEINVLISSISNGSDKDMCSKLLQDRMKQAFYKASREDSIKTYEAIKDGTFAGKIINISTFFDKFKDISYENVDAIEFSKLVQDVSGETRIHPPEVGIYLRTKLGKAMYDVFEAYLTDLQKGKFAADLKDTLTFMQKVNMSSYLTSWQKADLTAKVTPYIKQAFDKDCLKLADTFGSGYSQDTYLKYRRDGYAEYGMRELFESDMSHDIQDIRKRVDYLYSLNFEHNLLKLNGQFDLNPADEKYIARTLITDRTGATNGVREDSDTLRQYIHYITRMNESFTSEVKAENVENQILYRRLAQALNEANTNFVAGSYDKYTALLLLKSKIVAAFRSCMSVYSSGDGNRRDRISTKLTKIQALAQMWGTFEYDELDDSGNPTGVRLVHEGLLKKIDDALNSAEFNGLEKSATNNALPEVDNYTGVDKVEKALDNARQL